VAVALFFGIDDAGFGRAVGVFVDQQKILAGDERFVHHQLGALLVDGTRRATHAKFFALIVHTVCNDR
jgi:hypothetical protein